MTYGTRAEQIKPATTATMRHRLHMRHGRKPHHSMNLASVIPARKIGRYGIGVYSASAARIQRSNDRYGPAIGLVSRYTSAGPSHSANSTKQRISLPALFGHHLPAIRKGTQDTASLRSKASKRPYSRTSPASDSACNNNGSQSSLRRNADALGSATPQTTYAATRAGIADYTGYQPRQAGKVKVFLIQRLRSVA